jgi:hypothetical protein
MDGLSAAASILGIASFGIQLGEYLTEYVKGVRKADSELKSITASVKASSRIIQQIEDLLDREVAGRRETGQATIFSNEGLQDLLEHTNDCMNIFLKISVTITNKDKNERVVEGIVEREIIEIRRVQQTSGFYVPYPVERKTIFRGLERLQWPLLSSRFEGWQKELDGKKTNIMLLMQVAMLGERMKKP